ncbi:MAG: zf-HC2 domain-containing protein [Planctomycetes bacterium]|nr:zf-HC2 domain-containing protein [Planctomycetota bacterium]
MKDFLNTDGPSCNEIRALLVLFVGEDLDAAESARVARHLTECGPCRAEQARWVENRSRLASLRETTTFSGPSVWGEVRAELLREGRIARTGSDVAKARPTATPRVLRWAPIMGAAAAAAALIAFGVFTWLDRDAAPTTAPHQEPPIADVTPVEDAQPIHGAQFAGSPLHKAGVGEEALIFTAEPVDPFNRGRHGALTDPALNLAGDEEIR